MSKYLQRRFALSEQGGKDLTKAVFACAAANLGLIFPMGLLILFLEKLLLPVTGGKGIQIGLSGFIGLSLLFLILIFILQYIQYNKTFLASYQESANLRIRLAEKLRKIPLSFFGKRDLADLTTTIMGDCAWMETAFSHFIPELMGALLSTALVGLGMFFLDVKMALALLWVIPGAFMLSAGTRPLIDRMERKEKKKKLAASDGIQECIENIQDIKANNQRETYLKDLDSKIIAVEKGTVRMEVLNGSFVTASQMVLRLGMATTVLTGSFLMTERKLDLMVFLMFMVAATRIYGPLTGCLNNLSAVYSTLLQVERMRAIEEEPVQEGEEFTKLNGYDIVYDHVGFSYHQNETVLEDISFCARQGQVTALVGPSGGGKSTAARLAARFWDVEKGSVTIGGMDVKGIDPEYLLKHISVVFQDVMLFNNTVMENIRIGRKDATDNEVMEAAKAAQCMDFIRRLPEGFQTRIGENGSALSGGERQRLSIARALLKDAPVIILDEATASLDVENESLIQSAISNLIRNKTVLIIAHRMRTVAQADKIVVLKDGKVAEEGSPEVLYRKGGIYRHMTDLQNQSQNWSIG
ncbi:ABC transporter ATP-binding protein [Lacrimispora defluvii]|uniref:ABC transporter ATP-binding protein n=1 Tax=Lacrimispora defluvii TaxID=2719233 RepID=A0ABX1W1G2_9FIRM|nr:ABC transporter ATP-binding protein [Lacrimispora defluvii]NNJ33291.1 ABC transporter ATP-binding protein [Lacrimispora defluvii]